MNKFNVQLHFTLNDWPTTNDQLPLEDKKNEAAASVHFHQKQLASGIVTRLFYY